MLFALSLLCLLCSSNAQIYFPDDSGNVAYASPSNHNISIRINPTEDREVNPYEKYVESIISKGILKFTLGLKSVITTSTGNNYDNFVFAPISIAVALAVVLLGSTGKTFNEVSNIMGLATGVDIHQKSQAVHEQFGRMIVKLEKSSGFSIGNEVRFAAAMFVQDHFPIRPEFKSLVQTAYQSEIWNLDFATNPGHAQQVINNWVSSRTGGKIKSVLDEVPPSETKIIIASAMYFLAQWEYPFFEGMTSRKPFYTNGRNQPTNVLADMMANGGDFPYFKDKLLGCEILGLPYKGNKTTMYIVIPHNSNKENLKNLEKQMTPDHVERLVSSVRYTEALILFPKMLLESTINLKKTLEMLGLKSLFDPAEANLALLSPGEEETPDSVNEAWQNRFTANAPEQAPQQNEDVLIFSRFGKQNCSYPGTNCQGLRIPNYILQGRTGNKKRSLDNLRLQINEQQKSKPYKNPGLYADKVIHKVYMHITESGTEAAAVTAISLSRSGGNVSFRADVPFLFFIWHEETKTVLFWGSVNAPTPTYPKTF